MLYVTYTLNFLLMIALPWVLVFYLRRKFGTHWRIFVWGAVAFIGSQVVRIPLLTLFTAGFDQGLLPAIPEQYTTIFTLGVLSLTAGIFEEGARYIVYRRFIPDARTWKEGVSFGAGHGGIEAFIFGLLAAASTIGVFYLSSVDMTTLGMNAEQLALAQQQVNTFMSAPWYMTLLGAVERVFAMTFHISAAVMVLQVFRRNNIAWLFAAIAWHTLLNLSIGLVPVVGELGVEGILGLFALASLWIIFRLRDAAPTPPPASAETTLTTA
jgi:uncharacterized membrane protein YhfC